MCFCEHGPKEALIYLEKSYLPMDSRLSGNDNLFSASFVRPGPDDSCRKALIFKWYVSLFSWLVLQKHLLYGKCAIIFQ